MKKVLAAILALMMVFSGVSALAGDFDGITATETTNAVADLNNLKVMVGDTKGDFRGDATITRAEFSVILCRIGGFEGLAKSFGGNSSFADVQGHWAAGYIEVARNKGLINGYSAVQFGPQDPVTVEQAAKMLVCLLGYEDQNVRAKGFPYGYTTTGDKIGLAGESRKAGYYITNHIGLKATRNFIAFMVSNALDVPLVECNAFFTNPYDIPDDAYTIYDGLGGREYRTLRTENFGK